MRTIDRLRSWIRSVFTGAVSIRNSTPSFDFISINKSLNVLPTE